MVFPVVSMLPTLAFGQPAQPSIPASIPAQGLAGEGAFSGALWRLGGALLLLAFLLWGGAWLLRRLRLMPQQQGHRALRVIETLPLGTRERLALIEVDGQRFLLGSAPGRVGPLLALPSQGNANSTTSASTTASFENALNAAKASGDTS